MAFLHIRPPRPASLTGGSRGGGFPTESARATPSSQNVGGGVGGCVRNVGRGEPRSRRISPFSVTRDLTPVGPTPPSPPCKANRNPQSSYARNRKLEEIEQITNCRGGSEGRSELTRDRREDREIIFEQRSKRLSSYQKTKEEREGVGRAGRQEWNHRRRRKLTRQDFRGRE